MLFFNQYYSCYFLYAAKITQLELRTNKDKKTKKIGCLTTTDFQKQTT